MKRIFLLLFTNMAILVVLSVVASLFGLDRVLYQSGINFGALLGVSFVFGMGGAVQEVVICYP